MNEDQRKFLAWMASVDSYLLRKSGLTHLDLADINYRDLFDDGVSPREAADEALAENDFPGMED